MSPRDLPGMEALADKWREARQAFEQRDVREQRMLLAGALAVAVTVFYLGVWEPIAMARAEAQRELAEARATAQRIEEVAVLRPRDASAQAQPQADGRSLLARVNQLLRNSALESAPERMTPDGDNTVRIWMEDTPLDQMLRWLADLEQRPDMRLHSADIERDGDGVASARLQVESSS